MTAVERLKHHADPEVVKQAGMIEALFLDFESFAVPGPSAEAPIKPELNDDTNYHKYEVLRGFNLSPDQLIDVAKLDGLHELRIVRMLRLTFGWGLDEAMQLVRSRGLDN
ncbi:hypothetical protein CDL60_12825 [Roseateles noduli]|nr:hypothetical protein CDL60_12825 [Roseateles noduli]